MKRSFKYLFAVIVIVVSILGSGVGATPGSALATLADAGIEMPTSTWNTGSVWGVWGTATNQANAVGYGTPGSGQAPTPLVWNFNGTTWSPTSPGRPAGCTTGVLYGVWSSGPGHVHAVGTGTCDSTTKALLYHSTDGGLNWPDKSSSLTPGTSNSELHGIWGFSDTGHVYAVGNGPDSTPGPTFGLSRPIVYHYNGSSWSSSKLSLAGWSQAFLLDVWGLYNAGTGSYTIYAVGNGIITGTGGLPKPLLFSFTSAGGWQHVPLNLPDGWTLGNLAGVWGSSASDVYAVGSGTNAAGKTVPLVYRYNGAGWTSFSPALPANLDTTELNSVWGSDANHVYFAGKSSSTNRGVFYRRTSSGAWAGSSFSLAFGYLDFKDIWGSDLPEIYVVGLSNNNGDFPVLYKAGLDSVPPGNISGFDTGPGLCQGTMLLTWTDPADDGVTAATGPVESYAVKMKVNAPFGSWDDTVGVTEITTGLPVPTAPLASQSMTVTGLDPTKTYYFAIRAKDEDGLPSPNYATDSSPGAVQTAERPATWYMRGIGSATYGVACDIPVVADYTGDGKADIAVFRPGNNTWYIRGVGPAVYGAAGDIPVIADYTGDGMADIAVFRPSNNTWYIRGVGPAVYGGAGDIPVVGDYTGDGKADIAVFRPSNNTWYIRGVGSAVFGAAGDIPVIADYTGDGKADIAVFRPSNNTWYIRGVGSAVYGGAGDIPVVGDYTGDGMADIAVFRPSNNTWYIRGVGPAVYGGAGDIPVVADYTGDGKADIAVFRP